MSVRSAAAAVVYGLDDAWCRAFLATVGDRPGLLAFMFHAVEADGASSGGEAGLDPAQGLPVSSLDTFVRYFSDHGYRFVTPAQVRDGLEAAGRHVLMTFDDGYYNNFRILPVLEERDVPAVFFISTGHVAEGKAFWWDVVYRERTAAGASLDAVRAEQASLKALTHAAVDAYLVEHFGPGALVPAGDGDRPMTPDELQEFSRAPNVHIGNHTVNHAILTNYDPEAVEREIVSAQDWLESVTGRRPFAFSYPNGNYSESVVETTARCGIDVALTVEPRRNRVPGDDRERLTIGRFCFTRGHDSARTYRMYRAGVSPRAALARLRAGS